MSQNETPHIRINGDTIVITLRGKPYTVGSNHQNFKEISALLDQEDCSVDDLIKLVDVSAVLQKKFEKHASVNIEVRHGAVYYQGRQVHNAVTTRIIEFTDRGLPIGPLVKFLNNLMDNPSMRAVNELYDFLENKQMAITTDGHFLAYKGVTSDFKDVRTKTFDNSPGKICEVPRNMVDDDRDQTCSYGLHVGHYAYARGFAGTVVLVKVNPRDAVSVPKDSGCGKLRTCRYEVLRVYSSRDELEQEHVPEELPGSLYGSQGEDITVDEAEEGWEENNGVPEDDYECEGACSGVVEFEVDDNEAYGEGSCEGDDEGDGGMHLPGDLNVPPLPRLDASPEACPPGLEEDLTPSREELIEEATQTYLASYNRDNLCRKAAREGVYPSAEAARKAGKPVVARAMAEHDHPTE